ncbi:hypothetical protein ACOSQ4_007162 [Xanthoceras sorbifolium]
MLHVPRITKNLLSVFKLTKDNNLVVEFYSDCCVFKDKNLGTILLKRTLKDGLNNLNLTTSTSTSHPSLYSYCSSLNSCSNQLSSQFNKAVKCTSLSAQTVPIFPVNNTVKFDTMLAAKVNSGL